MGSPPEKETDITTQATEYKQVIPGKVILMIVASKNFQDKEYLIPRKIFEQSGAKVVVASSVKDKATSINGMEVIPDILLKNVKVKDYDAIVFVGGPGAKEYFDNSTAHSIATWGFGLKKPVAAICIAPVILANSGILSGRKATVWPGEADKLRNEGAIYTGTDVEIFGNIITADGPDASQKFAEAIVAALSK